MMNKNIIAIDIFQLNSWYRFNMKTVTNEMFIDLTQPINIAQIGLFAEEHDIFFAQLSDSLETFRNGMVWLVPFEAVTALIPLTHQAKHILAQRNYNLTFAEPLPESTFHQILQARNLFFSREGGEMILNIFDITKEKVTHYQKGFLQTMQKYPDMDKKLREASNLFDNLVFYERSRPFPTINSGFLFDVGAMAKDFLLNRHIEINTTYKEFGFFLYNNEKDECIFSKFQEEYEQSEVLQSLNKELSFLMNNTEKVNNILIIAFYFKFRSMLRNKEYKQFEKEAISFLAKTPKETAIALFMVGMFFGSTEFVELYYQKYLPLLKREEKTSSIISKGKEIIPQVAEPITEYKKDEKFLVFDKNLLAKIQKELIGKITNTTKKKITSIFEKIQPDLFNSDTSGDLSENFISALEHELKVKTAKGKYSKKEIIDKIKEVLGIV